MMESIIEAKEYHKDIPLLLLKDTTGSIHSIFQNGLNIRVGDGLIFIGSLKNGRLPFGIHTGEDDIQQLLYIAHKQPYVKIEKDSLLFVEENKTLTLDLRKGTAFFYPIEKKDKTKEYFPSFSLFLERLMLEDKTIGIEELSIVEFLEDYVQDTPDKDKELIRKLYQLMDAVFSDDPIFIEQTLRYFLGRGSGLTPSGDDLLVGALAINQYSNAFHSSFMDGMKKILQTSSVTTDVSKAYLESALQGKYSSVIANMVNDIAEINSEKIVQHFQELVNVGHSSGIDSAFGILIGMLAIRRKSE
ncbi:DUF2877 domain-containing protein [Virgibacillus sp. LDC-1]|uniref:DUF2877 domain-containing protein n=1 Tax=Virgibacillus sp. LDC-1 TaxID=3039856 RepID=UPI0024DE2B64|nr:DUF2877 domain-containing protein [Virgibacillus sp. LDC-1]